MAQRRVYRRSSRARPKGKQRAEASVKYSKPRIDPGLRPVFRKIGVPEPEPLTPDPFQLEALERIKDHDVLVSAPTGSGKTWIASQAIHSFLSKGLRVWYASPLKALSNSIYQEFGCEFGSNMCGILTGDRKENPEAPVIVGTTEILRNQLYDAMHLGTDIRTDLVILDEAHYLSDPDRGVVWEEVLIYLPSRVKILLLSATISNAGEVCAWLKKIRNKPNQVVIAEGRPVPLKTLFLLPDGLVAPLGENRRLNTKVKKFLGQRVEKSFGRLEKIDFGNIIHCMRELDLLPAIFFLKSRADCDRALLTCKQRNMNQKNEQISEALKLFCEDYPHLEGHRQIKWLMKSRVASHHGGQLPYWKMLVEKMMSNGYLEAIFSTSTVAAGVNFPARTVVLMQSDRFNGREFADLTATELHQMVGRAGRRGKDNIGFALIIPGRHQDPKLIHELMDTRPEPIASQININFSMTLNLLLSHSPIEVKDLLGRSFAAFQEKDLEVVWKRRWDRMSANLKSTLPKGKCDISDPFEVFENIEKRRDFKKDLKKEKRAALYGKTARAIEENLAPGSLFLHKNGNVYAVFKIHREKGRSLCMAHDIKKSLQDRRYPFRLRKIDLNQISAVLDYRVDIPFDYTPEMLDRLFGGISLEGVSQIHLEPSHRIGTGSVKTAIETEELEQQIRSMPCETCAHLRVCHGGSKSPFGKWIREFRLPTTHMMGSGEGLWLSFKRHLRFLKETGFVDAHDQLTPDGVWASKLRLDQPLLIAEAIRKGGVDDVSPEALAGGLAPFVWDRTLEKDMRVPGRFDLNDLGNVLDRIFDLIQGIRDLKKRRGFDDPPLQFWPAAALFMWAKGVPWEQLLTFVSVAEGDLASLIMRTADHLRQVANLQETHPNLADVAKEAVDLILREPVVID